MHSDGLFCAITPDLYATFWGLTYYDLVCDEGT
jgi:hypothetical protein